MDQGVKDNFLMRNHVYSVEKNEILVLEQNIQELGEYTYFKINRITRLSDDIGTTYRTMVNVITGLAQDSIYLSYIIKGSSQGISVILGCPKKYFTTVQSSFSSLFSEFEGEPVILSELNLPDMYQGVLIGHPKKIVNTDDTVYYPILKNMMGKEFCISIIAKCLPIQTVKPMSDTILSELSMASSEVNTSSSLKEAGADVTKQEVNYVSQNYLKHLEALQQMIENGLSSGMWEVQVSFGTTNDIDYPTLANLMKSQFSDVENQNENLKVIPIKNRPSCSVVLNYVDIEDEYSSYHPLNSEGYKFYRSLNHTIMSSNYLATYFQFPENEIPNFSIDENVSFEVSNRKNAAKKNFIIGNIKNNGNQLDNAYRLELDDLTRHALVVGMTGSGKTNTSKALLTELWDKHDVPFLVIESAKREYWDMVNIETVRSSFSDLSLFTLGEESVKRGVPFRLNPFEVIGNVSLQSHIDRIFATFKASFDLVAPTPFILEQALYDIYEDYGWDIVTNENRFNKKQFPTLTDLVLKIDEIVKTSGYQGEIQSNIQASLRARINSLRVGGKGMMLDVSESFPIKTILETPTILELEDLGDDETKSFVIGLLLTQLYEYRQSYNQTVGGDNIRHLLVIEEAHRLLKREKKEESNKARAIEFFTNLLSEIRSYGQGILIADQIPTKLAADTLKNTNLKIVHRTVTKEDRDAIGDSMNMTDEQKAYLSNLRRGIAAVYSEGDFHPKLVQMPLVRSRFRLSREDLIQKNVRKYHNYFTIEKQPLPSSEVKEIIDYWLRTGMANTFIETFRLCRFTDAKSELLKKLGERLSDLTIIDEKNACSYLIESLNIPQTNKKELLARLKKEYS